MEFRYLGNSGLKISAVSYGNWITHGSQVEEDLANACVKKALELGITTFDTADVYAGTRAEVVLGKALAGVRRESIEIFTKVYWPTGKGPNDRGLSRKHIMESINGSLRRMNLDYVDLYQAHRFDYETPLEETMVAFADIVRSGKALYIGAKVRSWQKNSAYRLFPANRSIRCSGESLKKTLCQRVKSSAFHRSYGHLSRRASSPGSTCQVHRCPRAHGRPIPTAGKT
jgi:aryl-alcohol dehydrogenase-like predicted oxidoreductase